MKSVYEATTSIDAHVIRNYLESEGISARVDGEYLQGAAGGIQASGLVRVVVDDRDYDAARVLMRRWDEDDTPNALEDYQQARRPGSRMPGLVVAAIVGALICAIVLALL